MAKAKVQKADDLFEQELIVGTIGAGATVTETPNLLRGLLGMKFKMVDGYVRPQDVVLAMERGEVEGGLSDRAVVFAREAGVAEERHRARVVHGGAGPGCRA